jgi:hypothetical protein
VHFQSTISSAFCIENQEGKSVGVARVIRQGSNVCVFGATPATGFVVYGSNRADAAIHTH